MGTVVAVAAMLAVLFLVARGTPGRNMLVIVAIVLAVVLVIVGIEQNGWWPETWRTR